MPRLITLIFLLLAATECHAQSQYWRWSPKAKHHEAVVKVRQGSSGGTGVLIAVDSRGNGYVATAEHVVSRGSTATAIWHSGKRSSGPVVVRDRANDGAIFRVTPPKGATIAWPSGHTPKAGDQVEHTGFGGPSDNLRHFVAKVRPEASQTRLVSTGNLLSGDSGGPVFYKGQVVGLNTGGTNTRSIGLVHNGDWQLVYPAGACGPAPLRQMFAQVFGGRWICQPGGDCIYQRRGETQPKGLPEHCPPETPKAPEPKAGPNVEQIVAQVKAANAKELAAITELVKANSEAIAALAARDTSQEAIQRLLREPATLDALAQAIAQRLPGFTVNAIATDGKGNTRVLDTEMIPLGGVLNIHHKPIPRGQ